MSIAEVSPGFPLNKEAGAKVNVRHNTQKPRKWWQLGGEDYSNVSVDAGYENTSETSSLNDSTSDVHNNKNNVYEDREAAEFYKPIEGYEGAHRFVPDATWTDAEEKKLVRTVRIGFITAILVLTLVARLANCSSGLHHVLCTSTRSWQHHSSDCRRHVE